METLKSQINGIFKLQAGTRVNGRVASERTKTARGEAIQAGFTRLISKGYKIQRVDNLSDKHIQALCESWHEDGLTAKTIQTNLSNFRIFCRWIGKRYGEKRDALPARRPSQ